MEETMKVKYNLDIFRIPKQKTINFKEKQLSYSTLQSILSLITNRYMYSDYESVEIPWQSFSNITQDYKIYLEYLEEMCIVMTYKGKNGKEIYSTGTTTNEPFCKKYAFFNSFKESALITEIQPDEVKFETEYNKDSIVDKEVFNHLKRDFSKIKVNKKYKKQYYNYWKDGVHIADFKNYISNMLRLSYLNIKSGSFKIKTNRLHTLFVQLSNDARLNNISFGDKKLVGFDIKSSYPLFFSIWCVENGIDVENTDFIDFCEGLKSGKFYNNLASKLNKIVESMPIDPKKEYEMKEPLKYYKNSFNPDQSSKLAFQVWINGSDNSITKEKKFKVDGKWISNKVLVDMNLCMKQYFPAINDLLLKNKINKTTFFYLLEEMEADTIFNKIIKKCYTQIPNIKILTCHDSIYFEENFLEQVEQIWDEEMNKLYSKLPINEYKQVNINDLDCLFEIINTYEQTDNSFLDEILD